MNIFLLELRNQRKSFIISTLSFCCVIFFMLAFFPSMQTESMKAMANAKLEGIDPAVLAALGLSQMVDFTIITNYFGYVLQFVTLAYMVVITQRSVTLFIKEETEGTIEYLFAKPVSRLEIYVEKILAHLLFMLVSCLLFAATTLVGYLLFSDYTFTQSLKEAITFYAAIFYVGLVFSAVGILLSTLIKSSKSSAGITIAIVFGSFILGIMSAVISQLDFLIWFSPMDWIKTQKLLTEGLHLGEWLVGTGTILAASIAGWLRYRTKDLLI